MPAIRDAYKNFHSLTLEIGMGAIGLPFIVKCLKNCSIYQHCWLSTAEYHLIFAFTSCIIKDSLSEKNGLFLGKVVNFLYFHNIFMV